MKITICGISELGEHCEAGVTHVLSILDPHWPDPEAFGDFPPHRREALRFHDVIAPAPELVAPTEEHIAQLLLFGSDVDVAGELAHLLIHCHAGISRSTAAAALLLAQEGPSRPAVEIFDQIALLRPRAWPNLAMLEIGEAALGRRGDLTAAVTGQYRRVLAADPDFATFLRDNGRGREVELAELSYV
ncbi:MAG TPA: protein-tyrosine-phosphatase [Stellaceae bacterium]|nr:protein-tyrosine-phosphatase [Stellaceae bacterium]